MKAISIIFFTGVGRKIAHLSLGALVVLTLLLMTVTTGFADADEFEHERGYKFCSQTSKAAFRASLHEIKDDFWIAVGNCNNLSDFEDRIECMTDAREGKKEGYEESRDQLEARLEVCDDVGEAPYDPQADPEDFINPLEIGTSETPNPYLPLIPGTVWVYEGGEETITVTVTDEIKEILGIPCIVVKDVVEEDGELVEDTDDWFAQDKDGNIWYFGEIALNYEDGELVDVEGSWKAGRDDAKQGYLIKRFPQVDEVFRQEFYLGDAEDVAKVESLSGSVELEGSETVPVSPCNDQCLVTREYTPIEPGFFENKYYAEGIGMVLEVDLETGDRVELVSFETP